MVEILATTSQFRKELEGAVASTNKANSGFQKMGRAAGVAGLALGGVLAYGLEKSVKAAMAAQVSTARLQTAYRDAGLSMGAYGKQIGAVEAAGRQLGFSNTEIREGLGSLITATHSERQAQMDLGIAEDLSRFKHVDLATAVKAETMAHAGSYRMLKQLGIVITPVTAAMDKLREQHMKTGTAAYFTAEAAAKLSDKLATLREVTDKTHAATAGAAGAFAHTAAGEMAQFHAQTTALMESLGQALLPALTKVAEKLAEFAGYLAKHKVLAEALVIGIGGLAVALGALSIASTIAAADMSAFWIAATGGLILLVPLVAAAVFEIIKHWDAIKSAFEAVGSAVKNAVMDVVNFVKGHWPLLLGILTGPIGLAVEQIATHWSAIRSDAESAWGGIKEFFRTTVGEIAHFFASLPSRIGDAIAGAMGDLKDALSSLFSWHKIVGWIKDALLGGSPSKPLMDVGAWMVDSIARGVGSAEGLLKDAIVRLAEKYVLPLFGTSGSAVPGTVAGPHGTVVGGGGLTSGNQALGQKMAAGYGWGSGAEWAALNAVAMRESGWSNTIWGSGVHTVQDLGGAEAAYGIAQAKPAGKYPFAGQPGGGSSASAQIGWMLSYIKGRYGDPVRAWAHEQSAGWYGSGGIFTQPTIIGVGERGPEAVVPLGRGGMGGVTVNVTVNGALMGSTVPEVADTIRRELLRTNRRNTGGLGFG